MRKQLFETKVKDGIWLVAILAVVVITSLSLDDVQGALRPGKIKVRIYVPSFDVPSDGAVIRPGDGVKLYKKVVGRIVSTDFFVARIKKPADAEPVPVPVVPGSPPPARKHRWDLVSGLKMEAELFRGQHPQILALISEDSTVRVESATLGDSSILILVSPIGKPVHDGSVINFPKNHASFFDPKDPASRYGEELTDPAQIEAVRQEMAAQPVRKGTPEPDKRNPSDDF